MVDWLTPKKVWFDFCLFLKFGQAILIGVLIMNF